VWTLRFIETKCTAAICRNDFGGEAALLVIADEVKANLIAQRMVMVRTTKLHMTG